MIKAWMYKVLALVIAALIGLALLASWDSLQARSRGTERPVERSHVQPVPVWSGVIAPEPLGRMGGLRPHMCPYEDGDPVARTLGHAVPCIWQNPRTGKTYYVSSAEYLD